MIRTLMLSLCSVFFSNCSSQELETVSYVDLNKYTGTWYEIASFPQRFTKDCHCTTAEYGLSEEGYITVKNKCKKGSINGKETSITGKAFVDDEVSNAKLKVQFFWPLKGKYWIIDLADDYSYAVVGHPNRESLWILCRKPQMDESIYNAIIARAKTIGFDVSKLQKTVQLVN